MGKMEKVECVISQKHSSLILVWRKCLRLIKQRKNWETIADWRRLRRYYVSMQCGILDLIPGGETSEPNKVCSSLNNNVQSWLVWLSGLSAGLQTKKVTSSIPSQGTCPPCRPCPQQGACKRQPVFPLQIDVSLFFFLSPSPLSKSK